jgi:aspartokinase
VRVFGAAGINLEFITESSDASGFANITAAVGQRDEDRVEELLPLIRRETRSIKVDHQPGCLMLGVSGQALRGVPGVAGRLFSAFGESQVNLLAIASSMSSLCCVVRQQDRAKAVQVFSDVFGGFPAISNGR